MEFTLSIGLHIPAWVLVAIAGSLVGTTCIVLFRRRLPTSMPEEHLHLNFAMEQPEKIKDPKQVQKS